MTDKTKNPINDFLWDNRLTVNELADKLDLHPITISRWKNGKPIPRTIELALKWLEVSDDQVFDGNNKRRTKLANKLELYNKWRRDEEDIPQPNPTEIGIWIDEAVKELRK
jgi:transcriptional regulator with XRE-family HTH domain